jgi:hypothetical protein
MSSSTKKGSPVPKIRVTGWEATEWEAAVIGYRP